MTSILTRILLDTSHADFKCRGHTADERSGSEGAHDGPPSVYLGVREICREPKETGEIKDRYAADGMVDGGVRDDFETLWLIGLR
ncbi:hypothetical protein CIB48_g2924 [Xylaria polymorpha]|nr:hypothetical protein CIB48_g2924 [Xylaria polymorpha]